VVRTTHSVFVSDDGKQALSKEEITQRAHGFMSQRKGTHEQSSSAPSNASGTRRTFTGSGCKAPADAPADGVRNRGRRRKVSSEEVAEFASINEVSVVWLLGSEAEGEELDDRVRLAARDLTKLKLEDLDKVLRHTICNYLHQEASKSRRLGAC
jgi:hypothetical protein